MNNRYTAAVNYIEQFINAVAEELCKDNEKLADMPAKLDYSIDILKAQPSYKGE